MKKKRLIISCSLLVLFIFIAVLGFIPSLVKEDIDESKYTNIANNNTPTEIQFDKNTYDTNYTFISSVDVSDDKFDYEGNVTIPADQEKITYDVNIKETGNYNLVLDTYQLVENSSKVVHLKLMVNDSIYRVNNNTKINLLSSYIYPFNDINISASGYQMINQSILNEGWQSIYLTDEGININKIQIPLEKGENKISIVKVSGELAFGNLHVEKAKSIRPYKEYIENHKDDQETNETFYIQAEQFTYKNKKSINPAYSTDLNVTPNNIYKKYHNVLSGSNFFKHNDKVSYELNINKSGLYKLGFSYKTGSRKNVPTFVNIYVNDEIPFKEFVNYKFVPNRAIDNMITDRYVYLSEGRNKIDLEISQSNVSQQYDKLITMSDEISDLAVEIRKLTGGKADKNRTWNMDEYFPELKQILNDYIIELQNMNDYLTKLFDDKKTEENLNLELAIKQLNRILENIDNLPNELNLFSKGTNSVLGRISSVMTNLKKTPLTIDTIYLTNDIKNLPKAVSNPLVKLQNTIKILTKSFKKDNINVDDSQVLEVWAKRPRQNMDIMQQLIDEQFTPKTGIKVNLSLLKNDDQTKLTLANSAGTNPDIVTGVDTYYISDIGQRGALEDLSEYEGAKEMISKVSAGAMLQMYVEDDIYGILENQNLSVIIYRKDILNKLGIQPPRVWDDVKKISSILQRNGMKFYIPLSRAVAYKPYPSTAPFIYQNGGRIFADDGFKTLIGDEKGLEAFELMTDLFTINGVAMNVESFYEDFRDGTVPIGITEFTDYLKLYFAAPEIWGKWDISLVPGIEKDGKLNRTIGGSGAGVMMFKNSEKKVQGWEFLQWWLLPDTQTEYMNRLQNTYGEEYLFIPANSETIKHLPIQSKHLDVAIEQISWIEEVQRIPGGYVAERELSNAWNKIVLEGYEVRRAVEEAETTINRELERKMEEFGYIKDGDIVKPYKVNKIEDIERWINND